MPRSSTTDNGSFSSHGAVPVPPVARKPAGSGPAAAAALRRDGSVSSNMDTSLVLEDVDAYDSFDEISERSTPSRTRSSKRAAVQRTDSGVHVPPSPASSTSSYHHTATSVAATNASSSQFQTHTGSSFGDGAPQPLARKYKTMRQTPYGDGYDDTASDGVEANLPYTDFQRCLAFLTVVVYCLTGVLAAICAAYLLGNMDKIGVSCCAPATMLTAGADGTTPLPHPTRATNVSVCVFDPRPLPANCTTLLPSACTERSQIHVVIGGLTLGTMAIFVAILVRVIDCTGSFDGLSISGFVFWLIATLANVSLCALFVARGAVYRGGKAVTSFDGRTGTAACRNDADVLVYTDPGFANGARTTALIIFAICGVQIVLLVTASCVMHWSRKWQREDAVHDLTKHTQQQEHRRGGQPSKSRSGDYHA